MLQQSAVFRDNEQVRLMQYTGLYGSTPGAADPPYALAATENENHLPVLIAI